MRGGPQARAAQSGRATPRRGGVGAPGGSDLTADPDILVAIAGRQHADQLSAALIEAGWHAVLHHTTPVRPALRATLARHHRLHALIGLTFRAGNRLLPAALADRLAYPMFAMLDRTVARTLRRRPPRAVIGYENSALRTFRAARALGIPTILDAASVHHRLQERAGVPAADTPFRRAINARKDEEIALADHILCCSTLAAQSYIDAGVPATRVHAVTLGFEPGAFAPAPDLGAGRTGALRIAFVGRFTEVKGADLLATALAALSERGLAFECRIAAGRSDGAPRIVAALEPHATLLGKLDAAELAELYRWADLLVLPSRFDSFGLVVPEALACGLPVLASDHVGAGDLIAAGTNGEIVPFGDAAALTEALARHAADPAIARAMRPAALASAHGAEWSSYRARVARTIADILGWPAP